jgi:SNF2 family DNA or RNA helicase
VITHSFSDYRGRASARLALFAKAAKKGIPRHGRARDGDSSMRPRFSSAAQKRHATPGVDAFFQHSPMLVESGAASSGETPAKKRSHASSAEDPTTKVSKKQTDSATLSAVETIPADPEAIDSADENYETSLRQLSPSRFSKVVANSTGYANSTFGSAVDVMCSGRWCRAVVQRPRVPYWPSLPTSGDSTVTLQFPSSATHLLDSLQTDGFLTLTQCNHVRQALEELEEPWSQRPMLSDTVSIQPSTFETGMRMLVANMPLKGVLTLAVLFCALLFSDVPAEALNKDGYLLEGGYHSYVDSGWGGVREDLARVLVGEEIYSVRLRRVELVRKSSCHDKHLCIRMNLHELNTIFPAQAAGRLLRWADNLEVVSKSSYGDIEILSTSSLYSGVWGGSKAPPPALSRVWILQLRHSRKPHLAPIYVQTLTEPLGSFEIRLPAAEAFVDANLAQELTDAFGPLSTMPLASIKDNTWNGHHPRFEALRAQFLAFIGMRQSSAQQDHPKETQLAAARHAAAQAVSVLHGLLLRYPMRFATVVQYQDESTEDERVDGAWVRLSVEVSLRPRAFLAATSAELDGTFERTGEVVPLTQQLVKLLSLEHSSPLHAGDWRAPTRELAKSELPIHRGRNAKNGFPVGERNTSNAQRASEHVARLLDATERLSNARVDLAASPQSLRVQLRPTQQRALAWMLRLEHANWPSDFSRLLTSSGHALYYGRGAFCLRRPAVSGMLLQEMGIGKTVEALALVVANQAGPEERALRRATLVVCPVTLLANWQAECNKVLPRAIKWLVLNSAAKRTHSAAKLASYDLVITSYGLLDLGTEDLPPYLREPGEPDKPRCAALRVRWRRVIFDESQALKDSTTIASRCARELDAPYRWALSGTPCPSGAFEFSGQFRALQLCPYDETGAFATHLLTDANARWTRTMWDTTRLSESKLEALQEQPLLRVLDLHAFRSTKRGEELLLPPLTIVDTELEPLAEDQAAYDELFAMAQSVIDRLSRANALADNTRRLTSLLMRLRMACDHPSLAMDAVQRMRDASEQTRRVAKEGDVGEVRLADVLAEAAPKPILHRWLSDLLEPLTDESSVGGAECAICMDEFIAPTLTPCAFPHMFCLTCLLDFMNAGQDGRVGKCPLCRTQFRDKELRVLKLPTAEEAAVEAAAQLAAHAAADMCKPSDAASGGGGEGSGAEVATATAAEAQRALRLASAPHSAKLDALVAALRAAIAGGERSVVFTHFNAFQRLCAQRLEAEGIRFVQIAGTSSQAERARALRSFTSDGGMVHVFLLSMRSASVGITLTSASRLFLMEPSLSLAQTQQAIGRLHRVGQLRPVVVTRYVLRGTVEPKVLTMHERDARRDKARERERGMITAWLTSAHRMDSSSTAPLSLPSSAAASSSGTAAEQHQQALDLPTLRMLLAPPAPPE